MTSLDIIDKSKINMISVYLLQPSKNILYSTQDLVLKTTLIIKEYNLTLFIKDKTLGKNNLIKEIMKEA